MPSSDSSNALSKISIKRPGPKTSGMLLWLLRIVTGSVFIISGWSKCVDINGFCLKITEYLTAMGLELPEEIILAGATGLSVVEFVTGIMLSTGCLRRVAVWTATAFMAVLLLLTVWTAAADPVSDCGCFGDFIYLSNTATLIKNIFICVAVGLLWAYNRKRGGLFPAAGQWLVITVSWIYPLWIAYAGYQTQPLVDFRPFHTGTMLFGNGDDTSEEQFIYERDGRRESFPLDALPDSTWTFVGSETAVADRENITVYTSEGEDITEDFAETLAESPGVLLLVVNDPEGQFMTRAHYLQELCNYLRTDGIEMYALVGASGATFNRWKRLTRPNFEAFEAEDTALKMLVRGQAGLVYLRNGRIEWKMTLGALSPDLPYRRIPAAEAMDAIRPVDSGAQMLGLTALYLGSMLLLYLLGLSPKMLKLLLRVQKFAGVEEKT